MFTFGYMIYFTRSCSDKSSPAPCLNGTYSTTGKMTCEICPNGNRCPTNALSAPIACVHGTYQNLTGQTVCLDCPGGYSCVKPEDAPVECLSGTFSPNAVSVCSICTPGHRFVMLEQLLFCPVMYLLHIR